MNPIKLPSLFVAGALLSACIASPPDATSHGSDTEVGEAREALTIPGGAFQNQTLNAGDFVYSPDGRTYLAMQSDGNLVLYFSPFKTWSQALWSTNTFGNPGAWADMQSDGNLVVYLHTCIQDPVKPSMQLCGKTPLWSSGTNKGSENVAEVQDDGNFVIYQTSGNVIEGSLWASGTYNIVPPASMCLSNFCATGTWWHTCSNDQGNLYCDLRACNITNNLPCGDSEVPSIQDYMGGKGPAFVSCENDNGRLRCENTSGQWQECQYDDSYYPSYCSNFQ